MHSLRFLRLSSLVAVAFSAAASVDAYGPAPAFCGEGGGCQTVANSALGQALGDLLPGLGVGAYTAILIASLSPLRPLRRLSLWASLAGGLAALGLLLAQGLSIGAFCRLCVGVDVTALAVAAFGARALRADNLTAASTWPLTAWAALYVIALGTPPAYAVSKPATVPPQVRSLWQPGHINVVEFSDFQCPYCRAMHPVLSEALAPYAERVHFVRLAYPLRSHAQAAPAARAYLCAQAQGRGEAMADVLYATDDLGKAGRIAAARAVGLDLAQWEACVEDRATFSEVERQRRTVAAAGMRGLPTVWIGSRRVLGFRKDAGAAPYEEALATAAAGRRATYHPGPWLVLGVIALLLVTLAARSDRRAG